MNALPYSPQTSHALTSVHLGLQAFSLAALCPSRVETCTHCGLAQVYKQKVKHLLFEHQQHIAALSVEADGQLRQATDGASRRIRELMVEKQDLKRDYNEQVSNAAHSTGIAQTCIMLYSDRMSSPWLAPGATSVSDTQITWQVQTIHTMWQLGA